MCSNCVLTFIIVLTIMYFVCRELGIAIVCYSPLGRGFFAGYKPENAAENDGRKVWRKFALLVGVMNIITIAFNLASGRNFQFAPRYHCLSYCATLVSLTCGYSSNIIFHNEGRGGGWFM